MRKQSGKVEFFSLLAFLIATVLLLTNGFVGRISAQDNQVDVYQAVEPFSVVLQHIMNDYVHEVDIDRVVESALEGLMDPEVLDRNSSFISAKTLQQIREDTKGEFEGIGIHVKLDDYGRLMIYSPLPNSPAAAAGLLPFDIIVAIDGVSLSEIWTASMDDNERLESAVDRIKGPRGTRVKLTVERQHEGSPVEQLEVEVKRAKVPLESIKEYWLLEDGIGYIRLEDFKDNTGKDLEARLKRFLNKGMKALVLDLRWNPGGLLYASQQVSEMFLPKGSLVTYTKGRMEGDGRPNKSDQKLVTGRRPLLPAGMPMVVLVNDQSASAAEIVTGALQFHERAIVVGEKTYGKGSVQTIIPLQRPKSTALRLTTALYYTPADVTIDHQGILPDVVVEMTPEEERRLQLQMYKTFRDDPTHMYRHNHGSVNGFEVTELTEELTEPEQKLVADFEALYGEESAELIKEFIDRKRKADATMEDTQLLRAVELLREDSAWENLLKKYHKDTKETQLSVDDATLAELPDAEQQLLNGGVKTPVAVE